MCMHLYLGVEREIKETGGEFLTVSDIKAKLGFFPSTIPHTYRLGAYTGCGCGFCHAYREDSDTEPTSDAELKVQQQGAESVRQLQRLICESLQYGRAYLYAFWAGEEGLPPKGQREMDVEAMHPELFCPETRTLYLLKKGPVCLGQQV